MGETIKLFDMPASSMDRAIASKAGSLEVMHAPKGMSFKVEFDVDKKIADAVADDPLLQQQMVDAIKDVYDDLVDRIGSNLKTTDKGAVKLYQNNETDKLEKLVKVVNKGIEGARDVALEAAQKAAMKGWAELAKKRKEYGKYKIKVGAKITLGVAGLAVSIGLLAGGVVSFGASSIPGIVGMVKSVVAIAAEIKSAGDEIEDTQKRLEKKLKAIEERFVGAKKEFTTKGKVQEVGVTLAAQLFGTSGPFAILPNIKDAAGDLGTAKNKLDGVKVHTHDAAKDLNKILVEVENAKKKFRADCQKELAKVPGPRSKADLARIDAATDAQLEPFTSKVQDALAAVIEFDKRYKTAEPKVAAAEKRVADLVKMKGLGWKIFENTIVFTDLALSFADPSQYAKVSETLANILPAAGALVADKLTKQITEGTMLE